MDRTMHVKKKKLKLYPENYIAPKFSIFASYQINEQLNSMRTYRRNDDTLVVGTKRRRRRRRFRILISYTGQHAIHACQSGQRNELDSKDDSYKSPAVCTKQWENHLFQTSSELRSSNCSTREGLRMIRRCIRRIKAIFSEIHGLSSTSRATIIIESSTFQFLSGRGSRIDVHRSIPPQTQTLFIPSPSHSTRNRERLSWGRGERYSRWWFNPWAGVIDLLPSIELPEILLHPRVWKRIDSTAANKHHGERD